ncbi:MAG: AAA family ATPase [Spirochaetota bacterium]
MENKIIKDSYMNPIIFINYLKKYVSGQDEAIEMLVTKVITHFNRLNYEKSRKLPEIEGNIKNNILLIGPSGTGKTYMVNLLAKKLNVPFVIRDATKYSQTGFRGDDIETVVNDLYEISGKNIEKTEKGIIFLDEFDKLALVGDKDYSTGWEVQKSLLKIIEGSEIKHNTFSLNENKTNEGAVINTKNILFIFAGAFPELPDIIGKRLNKNTVGFNKSTLIEKNDIIKNLNTNDLIKFGIEREILGRIPIVITLNNLTRKDYYNIISNKYSSIINSKKRDFASIGINLEFTAPALKYIADKAYKENIGVRGIKKIIEQTLYPFERDLDFTNIKTIKVTKDIVQNPHKVLCHMIEKMEKESKILNKNNY